MTPQEFYKALLLDFPFKPTNEQDRALEALADFIIDKNKDLMKKSSIKSCKYFHSGCFQHFIKIVTIIRLIVYEMIQWVIVTVKEIMFVVLCI